MWTIYYFEDSPQCGRSGRGNLAWGMEDEADQWCGVERVAVSSGGMSVLEQLVMVGKSMSSNTAMVDAVVCEEIIQVILYG